MKGPLVSILIPTFNRAAYVLRAIRSAQAQTYQNIEIIVYDDGSIDDTSKMLRQHRGITVHRRKTNRGVGNARNRLIAMARGEYSCWLDSDDLANRWRVQLLLRTIQKYDVPFVRSAITIFSGGKMPDVWEEKPYYAPRRQFSCATIMFRTNLARQVPYRTDLLLGEDALWEKDFILKHDTGVMVPLTLYHVGRGKGLKRLSQANRHGQAEEFSRSLRARDKAILKTIAAIRATGKDHRRFLQRVPQELCEKWVGEL
ncbi:hypothetical protein LCGC14_0624340 [marine sediment metagenome]|uniref:Glycosyltransferase 2-like domain-containing protein n=1 Tax=marine sediment metagenome TaxID=412755 RepID=A0A0F9UCE8_9ZZZZ